MYCTLQEAYSIPSFDPASKNASQRSKRSCAPLKGGLASDPYDAFGPESGRELAAAPRSYGREDFMNPGEKASYAAMANDAKYYCENYGVCSSKEGFENPPPSAGKTKRTSKQQRTCGPLQPPVYEYPLQESDRQRYNKALNEALKEEQVATAPYRTEPRKVDMDQVSGYYDEDLETYLQTKDMKASPALKELPKVDIKAQPYDPKDSPFAEAIQKYKGTSFAAPFSNVAATPSFDNGVWGTSRDKTGMWMDLIMFILLGILIIVLCDQLVRLGMMLGMRSTVEALQPLLARLEKA